MKSVQFTRVYNTHSMLQVSKDGPMSVVESSVVYPIKCYKVDYIGFSIAAVFEKQLNHASTFIKSHVDSIENFFLKMFEKSVEYVISHLKHLRDTIISDARFVYTMLVADIKHLFLRLYEWILTLFGDIVSALLSIIMVSPYIEALISFIVLYMYGCDCFRIVIVLSVFTIFVMFVFG